jgi:hypothetical protein
MIVVLEAVGGPITGRRIEIPAGTILRLGRTTRSDYPVAEDSYLSSLHFAVECDGVQARVRDMGSSNGTFVNGNRVTDQLVQEGDSVAAGESTFTIHLVETAPVLPTASDMARGATAVTPIFHPPGGPMGPVLGRSGPVVLPAAAGPWAGFSRGQSNLLNALYGSPQAAAQPGSGTVFAVLDAIRDSRIQAFLDASGESYLPLDPSGRVMVYVVAPTPLGRLLDVLIKDGWGRGWGFFCVSSFAMDEICAHLRNYMTLYTGAGRTLTFRFWDPRILRALAPALPPDEAADFFGPLARILVEGEKPEIALDLALTPHGPRQQTLMLV